MERAGLATITTVHGNWLSTLLEGLGKPLEVPPDEDINDNFPLLQGPITRARVCQLSYQVKSFFSSTFVVHEDRLLPNDAIVVRCEGNTYEELKNHPRSDQGRAQASRPVEG